MEKVLKIGDEVMWRDSFGNDDPKKATVTNIEVMDDVNDKEGDEVSEVKNINGEWEKPILVSLANGHWARGTQITII